MRPLVRRLAAASAAAYLLAGWLAAALHSHVGHAHPVTAESACTACSCGHHHGPEGSDDRSDEPAAPENGHHCVVCEHFAKPPLAVETVRLADGEEPIVPAAEPEIPAVVKVAPPAWRSRGPPVA